MRGRCLMAATRASASGSAFRRRAAPDGLGGRAYRPAAPDAHRRLLEALRAHADEGGAPVPCRGPEAEAWTG